MHCTRRTMKSRTKLDTCMKNEPSATNLRTNLDMSNFKLRETQASASPCQPLCPQNVKLPVAPVCSHLSFTRWAGLPRMKLIFPLHKLPPSLFSQSTNESAPSRPPEPIALINKTLSPLQKYPASILFFDISQFRVEFWDGFERPSFETNQRVAHQVVEQKASDGAGGHQEHQPTSSWPLAPVVALSCHLPSLPALFQRFHCQWHRGYQWWANFE